MNKAELIAAVAEKASGTEVEARQYIDAVLDTIMLRVAAGERVQVIGFGTFERAERAARTGRNPQTGQPLQVPAGVSPRFHAGQTFRTQVSGGVTPSAAEVRPAGEKAAPKAKKTVKAGAKAKPISKKAESAKPSVATEPVSPAVKAKPTSKKAVKAEVADSPKASAVTEPVTVAVKEKASAKKTDKPAKPTAVTGPAKAKQKSAKPSKSGKSGKK